MNELSKMLTNAPVLEMDPVAMAKLDLLLLPDGKFCYQPAADILEVGFPNVQAWCNARGRYVLPTTELLRWLEDRLWGLDKRKVLEIGAGMGDLGAGLNIRMTDSGLQRGAQMKWLYRAIGQVPTNPGKGIEIIDAINAAKKYKPHTIVAAFVTQKSKLHDTDVNGENRTVGSNYWGVDFDHLRHLCKRIVFLGNEVTHKDMRLLSERHQSYRVPGLITRSNDQSANVCWVWER